MIAEMLTHKHAEFTKKKYGQFLPESMTATGNAAAKILGGLCPLAYFRHYAACTVPYYNSMEVTNSLKEKLWGK